VLSWWWFWLGRPKGSVGVHRGQKPFVFIDSSVALSNNRNYKYRRRALLHAAERIPIGPSVVLPMHYKLRVYRHWPLLLFLTIEVLESSKTGRREISIWWLIKWRHGLPHMWCHTLRHGWRHHSTKSRAWSRSWFDNQSCKWCQALPNMPDR
jgi:hypothetical protein